MALGTRTVNINIEQQTEAAVILDFTPVLTGADSEVLLQKVYSATTDGNGDATINLPVKSSGTIKYTVQGRRPDFHIAFPKKIFYLSAGSAVNLADLIAAGGEATETTLDYINSLIIDEDDMASDSATKVPTQQSVKAYVDAHAGGGGSETTTTLGALINSASAAVPNNSDFVATAESGGVLKKITWTNVKAFLKTYFDTLYQPLNAVLTAFVALSPSNDDILQRKAGAWTNRTPAQVKTDLSLTKSDVGLGNVVNADTTTTANIADSTDKRFVTDAQRTVLQNTSGTNSGDQNLSAYATKTGAETLTNKTISGASNTLSNIAQSSVTNLTTDLAAKASKTGAETLTNKRITPRIGTTSSSATPTPDADAHDIYTVTALAAGATFGAPTGTPENGQGLIIRIKDNGTSRSLAFNAVYRAIGVTLPTATTISKTIYLGMIYNSADNVWDVVGVATEA